MDRGSTTEQLMAEMAWVRRLARALVGDPALADDVAQETWIVAAERSPDADQSLRPWLARVVRTLARTRRRTDVRRGLRERAAAVEQEAPSSEELVERVELQRIVAGEVLALAEPYRSTVLLHFVEGYTSAEIARRFGIPPGTVRRRLKTGLDQLRDALGARPDQPSKGWLGALAPLASKTPAAVGVVAMKKLALAIVIIVLLLVAAFVGVSRRGGNERSSHAVNTSRAPTIGARARAPAFPAWLAQAGAPDRRLAGQVVAGGAPVAKATVRLGLVVDNHAFQLVAEVTSDEQGKFDFGMQPAATFTVSAAASGHSPAALTIKLADPGVHADHVTLVLGDCRSHMFGTVTDASGGPIAKARFSVAGLSGGETDVGGQYSICLPLDALTLRIDADGYGSIEERIGTMNGVQTLTGELRRDFSLVPEAVLAGNVVDSNGHAVAGARVVARPALGDARRQIASGWADSTADGAFRITGLAPAQFELVASSDGFASTAPFVAVARAASTSQQLRLVLGSVARVRGQVVHGETAIAGATVVAATANKLESRKSVSQSDGTFVLDGVPMGAVVFTAAPYEVTAPKLVTIDRPQVEHVKLEVTAATKIHGHVTRAGKPIAGAQIATETSEQQAVADENGAYTLDGLPTGTVLIDAWDVREKAFSVAKRVVLAAGDDQQVDIELDGSGEIQGIVVDETGHPVAGTYVQFHLSNGGNDACETMTTADGTFDCPMLLGGDYAPRVQPSFDTRKGFAPAADAFPIVHVKPHELVTGVRLAIRNERVSIRGTVIGDSGPVADVRVEALGTPFGSLEVPSTMAAEDGGFEIRDLAPGTYAVHAHAADGGDSVVRGVVAGGAPVTIKLARPGAIDGTLAGFATPPTVTATLATEFTQSLATVDGATFSVTGLSPGRYAVQATAGADTDAVSVDVKSGETAHVALKSRGSGRIEGAIYQYGTTQPLVAARCDVAAAVGGGNFATDASRQTYADATGHFTLDAPIGHVRIVCIAPEPPWSGAGAELDVTAGQVANVTLYSVRPTFTTTTGSIGIKLQPLTFPITVGKVDPSGPAAAVGVQVGDHLLSIDGGSLAGLLPIGAWYLIIDHAAGSSLTLDIERGNAKRVVTVPVVDGGPP